MPFIDLTSLIPGQANANSDNTNGAAASNNDATSASPAAGAATDPATAQTQTPAATLTSAPATPATDIQVTPAAESAAAPVSIPSSIVVSQQQEAANADQPLAESIPVTELTPAVPTPIASESIPVPAPAPVSVPAAEPVVTADPIVASLPSTTEAAPLSEAAPVSAVPEVVPSPAVSEAIVSEVVAPATATPEAAPEVAEPPVTLVVGTENSVDPVMDTTTVASTSPSPVTASLPEAGVEAEEDPDVQVVTFTSTPDADDPDLPAEGAIPEVEVEDGLEISTEDSGIREVKGPEFDEVAEVEPAPPEQIDIQDNATPVVDSDDTQAAQVTDPATSTPAPAATPADNDMQAPGVVPTAMQPNEITEMPSLDGLTPVAGAAAALMPVPALPSAAAPVATDAMVSQPAKVEVPKMMPALNETEAGLSITPAASSTEQTASAVVPAPMPIETAPMQSQPAAAPLPESALTTKDYTLDELLHQAIDQGASDLHLTVGYRATIRIDGKLTQVQSNVLTDEMIREMLQVVIADRPNVDLTKVKDLDLAYQMPDSDTRFRVNIFRQRETIAAVFRVIPNRILSIEDLKLPPIVKEFTKFSQGLVLVTGPTGSGKSTTIASILNEINMTEPKHIVTIEDPIEYVYPAGTALVDQREVFSDTESWSDALRSVLRQDPDVVLVGEMRDLETIQAAIRTAETGHLVFATLHTNSASQSVDRIIDVFPEHQQSQIRTQLASVLQVVLSQRLVPMTGGGRQAAIEIMLANAAVRNAIRDDKVYQIDNMIQTGADIGMITMEQSLVNMVKEGRISAEKAQEYANKPADIQILLGKS